MSKDDTLFSINEFIEGGKELFGMGMYEELIHLCYEFLEKNKDDRVYSMLASAEFSLGDVAAAEKNVRTGLKVNPKNPDLLYNLACILKYKNILSNAVRYYVRAEKASLEIIENENDESGDYKELVDICRSEILSLEKVLGKTADKIIPPKAKKKVIIVAGIYPPLSGSGVQRTVKLVKYLRFFGWEPIVVTSALINEESIFLGDEYYDELPDDIEVLRIARREITTISDLDYMLAKILPGLSNPVKEKLKLYCERLNTDMKNKLLAFPDLSILWAALVADNLYKYVDIDDISAIYSTSAPYSDHITGYYVRKLYGIPWVADFRDEWSQNPLIWPDKESLHYDMCIDWEQAIFKNADHVICVTEQSYDSFLRLGLAKDNLSCITNGYDEEDFEWFNNIDSENIINKDNEKFTIVHNGILYYDRSVTTIIQALKNLIDRKQIDSDKVTLHIGNAPSKSDRKEPEKLITKYGMENIALFTPYLEHHDSLVHTACADLLLVLLGPSKDYAATYPAKIFEYLRFGKQILNLGPIGGVLDKLLLKTGHGCTVDYSDIEGIENELLRLYKLWEKNPSGLLLNKKAYDITIFDRKNLTKRHAGIFDMVCKNSNSLEQKKSRDIQTNNRTKYPDFYEILVRGNIQHVLSTINGEIEKRDYQQAINFCKVWIDFKDGVSGLTYYYYAVALNVLGKYDEALAMHNKSIELSPIMANFVTQQEPSVLPEYDEYDSNCIGCGSNDAKIVFVCNQSIKANNFGVLNPICIWKKCNKCRLTFRSNMPSGSALGKYYAMHHENTKSGGGAFGVSEMGDTEGYLSFSNNRIKQIHEFTGKPGRLLDIGAGIGTFVKVAKDNGWLIEGLESSPDNVLYTKNKFGIDLIKQDFFEFEPEHKYDVITMFEVIEHLINPWEALKRCSEFLLPGGILLIAAPFNDSDFVKAQNPAYDFWWNEPSHLTYTDTKCLIDNAEKFGLECINIKDSEQGAGRLEVYFRKA
ncbi:MAG: methyltransferase domain-containing protein [Oscillospiraceae bacterium]|nr:methyltransferase domain-containing protein [Oscillospiraceae bacterium]